jgi:hypothetical protein
MQELLEQHRQYIERIAYFEKQLVDSLLVSLETVSAQFFKDFPEILSVYWTQYAPHFNDGDACEFSVGDVSYTIDGDVLVEDGEDEGEGSYLYEDTDVERATKRVNDCTLYASDPEYFNKPDENYRRHSQYWLPHLAEAIYNLEQITKQIEQLGNRGPLMRKGIEELYTFIQSVPANIMQEVFGDSVRVELTAEGVSVEDYEHD